jgi:hypothetical protein
MAFDRNLLIVFIQDEYPTKTLGMTVRDLGNLSGEI